MPRVPTRRSAAPERRKSTARRPRDSGRTREPPRDSGGAVADGGADGAGGDAATHGRAARKAARRGRPQSANGSTSSKRTRRLGGTGRRGPLLLPASTRRRFAAERITSARRPEAISPPRA